MVKIENNPHLSLPYPAKPKANKPQQQQQQVKEKRSYEFHPTSRAAAVTKKLRLLHENKDNINNTVDIIEAILSILKLHQILNYEHSHLKN
jgi:hypothetical protein